MRNLQVTATMATAIAVFDDWSPALDGLLEYLILQRHNRVSPNPTDAEIEATRPLVESEMPLQRAEIGGEWYWATSSPCYRYRVEQSDQFRKRWAPGIDCPPPDWKKRQPKWDTSQGKEKSYDLPLYIRSMPQIHWFCVGDLEAIQDLLNGCAGIGKKRSIGHGQVASWSVSPIDYDYHLLRAGMLMRPIPCELLPPTNMDFSIRNWGWRPPAYHVSNKARCAMPIHTVQRVG